MRRASIQARAALVVCAIVASVAPAFAVSPPDQYQTFTRDQNTIRDAKTRLEWQRDVRDEAFKWVNASSHCSSLTLDGLAGWRMPTYKELLTIVDEDPHTEVENGELVPKALDPNAFHDAPVPYYWTSTPLAGNPSLMWQINFKSGASGTQDKDSSLYVRCVRDF